MLRDGHLARLGMPSSTGIPNLPAAAWLFAVPYTASHDPLVATAFVGVLGLGTVIGVWALGRVAWGAPAGLIAAAYLAAAPYSVLYARNIWAQNLLPPLAVAWLATDLLAVTAPPRRVKAPAARCLDLGARRAERDQLPDTFCRGGAGRGDAGRGGALPLVVLVARRCCGD